MVAAVVTLALAVASLTVTTIWLARLYATEVRHSGAAITARYAAEAEVTRRRIELEVAQETVRTATRRASVLEEELSDALAHPVSALAPDDVRGRILLLARRWAGAGGDPVSDTSRPTMPDAPTPSATTASGAEPR